MLGRPPAGLMARRAYSPRAPSIPDIPAGGVRLCGTLVLRTAFGVPPNLAAYARRLHVSKLAVYYRGWYGKRT
jgi:hypothetical protein